MPITVGTIQGITFAVDKEASVEQGNQVRLQMARYAQQCPTIKTFLLAVPAVTVLMKAYKGSGAVTIHKNRTVIVSNSLKGGVPEMAESALFELVNWSQGDFATREQNRLKNGDITPEQAGEAIAGCEAFSVHRHGEFMQAIKAKGMPLSTYGEKQRAATAGKSLQNVQAITLASAHDEDAASTDMMSLKTPEMYWYQSIDGVANAVITARAVNALPEWLDKCIKLAWQYNDLLAAVGSAALYVKLLRLAKLGGCTLKGGYEFTAAMKLVAGEMTVASPRFQMSAKAIPGEKGMPAKLNDWLKEARLLA
jgi:hypothetical protein